MAHHWHHAQPTKPTWGPDKETPKKEKYPRTTNNTHRQGTRCTLRHQAGCRCPGRTRHPRRWPRHWGKTFLRGRRHRHPNCQRQTRCRLGTAPGQPPARPRGRTWRGRHQGGDNSIGTGLGQDWDRIGTRLGRAASAAKPQAGRVREQRSQTSQPQPVHLSVIKGSLCRSQASARKNAPDLHHHPRTPIPRHGATPNPPSRGRGAASSARRRRGSPHAAVGARGTGAAQGRPSGVGEPPRCARKARQAACGAEGPQATRPTARRGVQTQGGAQGARGARRTRCRP